jgi:hypothetical protein
LNKDKFWTSIVPVCLADAKDGEKLAGLLRSKGLNKSFSQYLKNLDESEFNLFLAKLVIKASGQGVVGVQLTEKIGQLKEMHLA